LLEARSPMLASYEPLINPEGSTLT
jgi:hypothetical protein